MKSLIKKLLREELTSDYKSWKRKNVTLRGISKTPDEFNGGGAMLGDGLYTAALGNKQMAKGYGTLYFVVGAIPKTPKIFNTLNDWEIWFYNTLVFQYSKANGKDFPDKRDFNQKTTIEKEMTKIGYDGIIIKGREMVNYKPENVKYFRSEDELIHYHRNIGNELNEQNRVKNITVFHGTNIKFLEDIKQHGLTSNLGYDNASWYMVSTDLNSALFHATPSDEESDVYVLEFNIPSTNEKWEGYPYFWPPYDRSLNSKWFSLKQPLPHNLIKKIHKIPYSNWIEIKGTKNF